MAAYKEDNGHIRIHHDVICDGTYYFLYECFYKSVIEARAIVDMTEYSDYFYIKTEQTSQEADKEEISEDKPWCNWYFAVDIILSNIEAERPAKKDNKEVEIKEESRFITNGCYQRVEYIDTNCRYAWE